MERDGPGWRRLRAAVFHQPLFTTSTAKRRLRSAKKQRREWGLARWVRRNPGFAIWFVLFVSVGLVVWPETGVSFRRLFSNPLEERARRAVAEVLDFVGDEVVITAVVVAERAPEIAATYSYKTRTITISPLVDAYDEDEFLALVGHEVVHAMFHQMDWSETRGSADWRSFQLAHETAAEVLGAYLAGLVRSRRGGDGRYLTERFVRRHRNLCDTQSPHGFYQRFARARAEGGLNAVDEEWEYVVFTHVGSTEMVDDIDRICRENPDPWDAVRVIGEKYLFTDREPEQVAKGSSWNR